MEPLDNRFWIAVERWDYLSWKCENGSFAIWYHVRPGDGGYGREVGLGLSPDYFQTHTVEELYDYIAGKNQRCSPWGFDREKQITDLQQVLLIEKRIE